MAMIAIKLCCGKFPINTLFGRQLVVDINSEFIPRTLLIKILYLHSYTISDNDKTTNALLTGREE